jgi:hypothetical protein
MSEAWADWFLTAAQWTRREEEMRVLFVYNGLHLRLIEIIYSLKLFAPSSKLIKRFYWAWDFFDDEV